VVRLRPQLLQRCALLLIGSQWPLPLQAECRMVAQTLLVTGAAGMAFLIQATWLTKFSSGRDGGMPPVRFSTTALHFTALRFAISPCNDTPARRTKQPVLLVLVPAKTLQQPYSVHAPSIAPGDPFDMSDEAKRDPDASAERTAVSKAPQDPASTSSKADEQLK
jgi:hypothetical protein